MKKLAITLCSVAALGFGIASAQDTISEEVTEEGAALPGSYNSQTEDDLVKNAPGPAGEMPEADANPRGFKSKTPGATITEGIAEEVIEERGNERVGFIEKDIPDAPDADSEELLNRGFNSQDPDAMVGEPASEEIAEERAIQ